MAVLPRKFVQPSQFRFELRDHQFHDPDRLVIRMPYFLQNTPQSGFLLPKFLLQILPPPANLFLENLMALEAACLGGHAAQRLLPVPAVLCRQSC